MAYDPDFAGRVGELIEEPVTERRMFGGLAFLVDGNMAVVVSGQGGLMVRVGRGAADELVARTPANAMEMGGRVMRGWVRIDSGHLGEHDALHAWVERGVAFARTLPPK